MTILLGWWRKHRARVLAEIHRADLGTARAPVKGTRARINARVPLPAVRVLVSARLAAAAFPVLDLLAALVFGALPFPVVLMRRLPRLRLGHRYSHSSRCARPSSMPGATRFGGMTTFTAGSPVMPGPSDGTKASGTPPAVSASATSAEHTR